MKTTCNNIRSETGENNIKHDKVNIFNTDKEYNKNINAEIFNNSSQHNMFWAFNLPIIRSTRLCVTACGITHPRCCRPVAGNIVGALYHKL